MPLHMHWSDAITASSPYRWTMLGAIVLSAWLWSRRTKRDPVLMIVYAGALGGAFAGAKLAWLIAEGAEAWASPNRWLMIATGKSVVGGILGGYAGVEFMKAMVGYKKSTGDLFAPIIPLGIALGRVGCMLHGCCGGNAMPAMWWTVQDARGISRWPSAQIEFVFQLIMFAVLVTLLRRPAWHGRVFYLYLVSYGGFRLAHEVVRDTPKWFDLVSGYQLLSAVMLIIGIIQLRRHPASETNQPAAERSTAG